MRRHCHVRWASPPARRLAGLRRPAGGPSGENLIQSSRPPPQELRRWRAFGCRRAGRVGLLILRLRAFTFIDYKQDWDGVAENLTWSQLYRRTLNLAQELKDCGSTGDRAVILAPQGLDYIAAFLGALEAG